MVSLIKVGYFFPYFTGKYKKERGVKITVTTERKKIKTQTIYINLDDSGKMSTKEKIATYGGIVFQSKKEKDKFITQYRSIVNDIKCKYCQNKVCDKNSCPELKHHNLKNSDIRRITNYIKKYMVVALIIKNDKIYNHIIQDKASKGRYIDYALRRFIKGIIFSLVKEGKINPDDPINIVLNIDQQTTKSNGYYDLKSGLFEELKYGIINFNYSKKHKPIVHGKLDINLTYQRSDKSYVIQAADLVAGMVRKINLSVSDSEEIGKKLAFIYFKLFLP